MSEGEDPTPQPPPLGGERETTSPPPGALFNGGPAGAAASPVATALSATPDGNAGGRTASLPATGKASPWRGRKWLLLALVLVALAAFGVWYFALRGPRDDLGRWQGEWQVAVPAVGRDNKPGARLKPVTIRVAGDRWTYLGDGKELSRCTLTLRPEATPKEIDLAQLDRDGNPTPLAQHGIYEISGGRARVLLVPAGEPRPTSFDAKDGPPGWILERVN